MSDPKFADTDETTGARWYVHPRTGERFISVTTVLSNVAKYGLPGWSAKLTAQAAYKHLPRLNASLANDPCQMVGEDACGVCPPCVRVWLADRHNVERDHAASLGTRTHDAAQELALFGEGATVDEEVRPFVSGYQRWVDTWKPEFELTEATVISRKWGYAGTLDWAARFQEANLPKQFQHMANALTCGDTKTGKHLDIQKGWQVLAYSRCDSILLPDGSEEPLPAIDFGLILHIRPELVQLREVFLTDANFQFFVHLLRVAEGLGAGLNSVLSRPFTLKEKSL